MKTPYFIQILASFYCKIVFILAFGVSYFFLPPHVLYGHHAWLAIIFMIVFSFSLACIVRNIKEKVVLSRTYKTSVLSLILSILGFSAFQVCGLGASVCGLSAGAGVLAIFFPGFVLNFLSDNSTFIVSFSIVIQTFVLYSMNCFKHFSGRCDFVHDIRSSDKND